MSMVSNEDDNIASIDPDDVQPCMSCGVLTRIDLLDAKPDDPDNPDSCDWNRLECKSCYGHGWLPMA